MSVTPLGGVILLILAVAVGLFLFGPSSVQAPGLIVAVLLLAGLLGVSPFGRGGTGLWRSGSLAERRREFHPTHRDVSDTPLTSSQEAELWAKERERRAKDQRD